jgi:hypothetical protein
MSKEITFNGKRYRLSQGIVVYWAPRNGWVRETDSEIVEKVKAMAKTDPVVECKPLFV